MSGSIARLPGFQPFKQPSAEELEHDFLWRTTCHLPNAGGSESSSLYYEEVLVVRVPEILPLRGSRRVA